MDLAGKIGNGLARLRDEASLHRRGLAHARSSGHRPRVLFFPSAGPEGASLLRGYNMAEELAGRGWLSASVSPLIGRRGRQRVIALFRPDLLVFQQCRHALNGPEAAFGVPFVLDTDDADFYLTIPGLPERLERTSRNAAGVIAGSRFLRDWHAGRCPRTTVIWTGSPVSAGPRTPHLQRAADGPPVLVWAQAKPLAYEQELAFVARLAAQLVDAGLAFTLRFHGVDAEAEATALRQMMPAGLSVQTLPTLPYGDFLRSLDDAAVGLSPIVASSPFSRGKSFGKILGYLDAKVPVIASDEADHRLFFDGRNGVATNDPGAWIAAASRLLRDPAMRQQMADAAFADFQRRLSLAAAADRTDAFLRMLIARGGPIPARARGRTHRGG